MNQNITTMREGERLNAPSLLADAAKGEIAFKHPTTNENISFKSDDYYQSTISEINNSIATVSNKINAISSTTTTNTTKIASIESNIGDIESDVTGNSSAISNINGEISAIKTNITDIQEDITTLSGKSWLYFVSLEELTNSSTSFQINAALGGLQNAINAVKSGCLFVLGVNHNEFQKNYVQPVMATFNATAERYIMVFNYLSAINNTQNYRSIAINGTNENDLKCSVSTEQILINADYKDLQTDNKTIFGAINECAKKTITLSVYSSHMFTVNTRSETGTVRYGESVGVFPTTISVTSDATTSDAVAEAKEKGLRLLFNNYGVYDIASICEYNGTTYLTFNFVASLYFGTGDANTGLYLCMSTFRWNADNNELELLTGAGQHGNLIILRRL